MNDVISAPSDDDRIAAAAKRIIRQYRLQQSDRSEESGATVGHVVRPTANLEGMCLLLDDMGQKIEQMQRLMTSREAVFMAVIERLERNLAKTAGRVDGLAAELGQLASQPSLDLDAVMDEQRMATRAVMTEFAQMMALGRTLLDEARDVRADSINEANAAALRL